MALVTGVVLPNNGDRIKAENYNDPINKMLGQVNGNLDDSNISGLNGNKIAAGSITQDKLSTALNFAGWAPLGAVPTAVTANGNRSYDLTFAADQSSVLSPGMRLRTTRTVQAPTQSTSLNGTNQYWNDTTVSGMTFTDDFTASAWVRLSSYPTSGSIGVISSRGNSTNGWGFWIDASGQVVLNGRNGAAGNFSRVVSYQSVPLNKWVHITAQLDMSAFTATPTTSYVMLDGVDVPASVSRAGTNPIALIQAGNLEIGSMDGGLYPFPGKIAQVAIFSAKVPQATMRGYISQGLTGTETSLISAYSFNGNSNDLNTTNANNLTPNGSAVATSTDSPFGGQASGTISSTLDYAIVQKVTASTVTVQVAEGCTIPTTGGVASVSYSSVKSPYGFPGQRQKWTVKMLQRTIANIANVGTSTAVAYTGLGHQLLIPVGAWNATIQVSAQANAGAGDLTIRVGLSTSSSSESDRDFTAGAESNSSSVLQMPAYRQGYLEVPSTPTTYYLVMVYANGNGVAGLYFRGDVASSIIEVENAYL